MLLPLGALGLGLLTGVIIALIILSRPPKGPHDR